MRITSKESDSFHHKVFVVELTGRELEYIAGFSLHKEFATARSPFGSEPASIAEAIYKAVPGAHLKALHQGALSLRSTFGG